MRLQAQPNSAVREAAISVFYLRVGTAEPLVLALRKLTLTPGEVTTSLQVPLDACLADPSRETVSRAGCPLRVAVALRAVNGVLLDSASTPVLSALPGAVLNAPQLLLAVPGAIEILLPDSIELGSEVSLQAVVRDSAGAVLPGRPVTWSSNASAIARVSDSATLTALAFGTTELEARSLEAISMKSVRVVPRPARCDSVPTLTERSGTFTSSETWTAAISPIIIPDSAIYTNGAVLTIGPGVTVCASPTARLALRGGASLQATGTATAPIVFRPLTGTRFRAPSFESNAAGSTVRHAVFIGSEASLVVNDSLAIAALPLHPVLWDSVRFSRSVNLAVSLTPGSSIRGSVIDTIVGGTGVPSVLAGMAIQAFRKSTIDNVTIRQCAASAIFVTGDSVLMSDTRIQRCLSAINTEFSVRTDFAPGSEVPTMEQLSSYPMILSGAGFATLLPDSASQSRLLGRGGPDTVLVLERLRNRFDSGTMTIFGHLPVRIANRLEVSGTAQLVVRAGASLIMDNLAVMAFSNQATLQMRGSPAQPARIRPGSLSAPWDILFFEGESTSRIANAIIEGGSVGNPWMIWVNEAHRMEIDSSLIRGARKGSVLSQTSRGVVVRRSVVDSTGRDPTWTGSAIGGANLTLEDVRVTNARAHGVGVVGLIAVDGLEITGSGGDGLEITPFYDPSSTWSRVNVFGNGGVGLRNQGPIVRTFSNFWWGDPAGPAGPSGDGVAGPVTVIAPAPAFWPVAPAPPTVIVQPGLQRRK